MRISVHKHILFRLVFAITAGTSLFFLSCTGQKPSASELVALEPSISVSPEFKSIQVNPLPISLTSYLQSANISQQQWDQLFGVYVLDENGKAWDEDDLPVNGTYSVKENEIVFTPRYSFLKDTDYYIRFDLSQIPDINLEQEYAPAIVEHRFTVEVEQQVATYVEQVYPTSSVLPRNLLKFYIQFSASMIEGELLDNIHLIDSEGDTLEHVFLEIPQELWDSDRKRVTVLFDPGRVKRGLQLREQFDTAFNVGEAYTLVINNEWKDGRQKPIQEVFKKTFTISDDDQIRPNPNQWVVQSPKSETRESLKINFNESLDYALLKRVVTVHNEQGLLINGSISIGENEKEWIFEPDDHWNAANYYIQIEAILEDMAGNNLNSIFDVDLEIATEQEVRSEPIPYIRIPFKTK